MLPLNGLRPELRLWLLLKYLTKGTIGIVIEEESPAVKTLAIGIATVIGTVAILAQPSVTNGSRKCRKIEMSRCKDGCSPCNLKVDKSANDA